jgi:hypothetical protein
METKKTTDEKVRELFETVQQKKLAIEKAERPCWKTSTEFSYNPNSVHDRIKVPLIERVDKLVEMLAFLIERKEKTEQASKKLGVTHNFKWLGFTLEEWESDFVTRANQISLKEKRQELAEIEARLNAILSPELKAQMELEALSELLEK